QAVVDLARGRQRLGEVEAGGLLATLPLRTVEEEPEVVQAEEERHVVELVETVRARLLKTDQGAVLVERDLPPLRQIAAERVPVELSLALQREVGEEQPGPGPRQRDQVQARVQDLPRRV